METSALATYFVCEIPGDSRCVHLNVDIVERLGLQVMEGFKALPKRGLEVGGLLLGSVHDDGVVVVDDFEPFASEHQSGPSYVLSEKDKLSLEGRISHWKSPECELRLVGLYRSHTRPGFEPATADQSLMAEHCSRSGGIFLLLKPMPTHQVVGAFFAGAGGLCARSPEFPLHRGELAKGFPLIELSCPHSEPPSVPAAPPPRHPRLELDSVVQSFAQAMNHRPGSPRRSARRTWLAVAAILIVQIGLLGYWAWHFTPHPQAAPPAAPPAASMGLDVAWTEGSLHLHWNGSAPLVRKASRGILRITDGPHQQRLDLDARQLNAGRIRYWPSGNDVDFQLELFDSKGSASESMRAVNIPVAGRQDPRPPTLSATVDIEFRLKSVKGFVPPAALHRVMPALSPALRRATEQALVDVKVEIDSSGKVRRAALVSQRTKPPRALADLALKASRRWLFEPARIGQRKQPGEAILHYRFGKPVAEIALN